MTGKKITFDNGNKITSVLSFIFHVSNNVCKKEQRKIFANEHVNMLKDDVFQSVTQAYSEKEIFRVLATGVKPMTFRLVLRMLYH